MPNDDENLEALQAQFNVSGIVSVESGNGGLTRLIVTTPDAEGEIYLHGAHLTRFQPKNKPDLLFMSGTSKFAPGKAIRGGVPVIFPWFGPHPTDTNLPQHGVARTMEWSLTDVAQNSDGTVTVTLDMISSPETRVIWPHEFALRYAVTIGPELELALTVTNTANAPFSFEEALHTYLAVQDVRQTVITGLSGAEYFDKVDGGKRKTEAAKSLMLTGETDRVYLDTFGPYSVRDASTKTTITVEKKNSACTVVWNPWEAKAETMSDLAGEQWPRMLCVESVNVGEFAVPLAPGESHTMQTRIWADH